MKFAVIATPTTSGADWAERARRLEGAGWQAVLVPDAGAIPSTFPTLAAAAAVTTTLRLRTWVLAIPLRSAAAVVRETAALQVLSDGRFELGLGTGRPDAQKEATQLGLPWPTGSQRRQQLLDVAGAVRAEVSPAPPIVVTASGEKMIAAAAPVVDCVALALRPAATEQDLDAAVQQVRAVAPAVPLSLQAMGVGGRLPAYMARAGINGDALLNGGAIGMLPADPAAIVDVLQGRQERWGVDEIVVAEDFVDDFAPVLAQLSGQ
ncbi:luciferase-like monooxygenase [Antricoccus suffuscus]|uniref:Luciferase-like monooxygenase n=1 Tax=Antricoccus suffuscus TaxID=1629062 RepID=A0A2T1A6N5_9ACTN|nr:LLM class flavin-dependent oxidoreductase [Antricoccus suffuscus]PRZ44272.1 luciferase-like monooxygenase [Antricoccus suffuscus]